MSTLKLKDNYQINLLYQQFKNQSLPNQDRFYYAKLLIEQCISMIIAYPDKETKHYFDLNVINSNDNILNYLKDIIYRFDIETIELLDQKIRLSKFNQTDDNQLFRRLAMLLFNIINNEISFLKKNIKTSLESEIQKEIDLLVSKMDTFINYENQIEKLEYELDDLKSVYSFSNDERTKNEIDKINCQISELKSKDLYTNQKKLDELQLLKAKVPNSNIDNKYLQGSSNLINNSNKKERNYNSVIPSQDSSELIARYPDLNSLINTDVYKEFLILYEKGIFYELESRINELRSVFLNRYNYPQYVFKETVVDQILFYLPISEKELLGIKYIGKVFITYIGKEVLKIVNTSLESNQNLKSHKDITISLLNSIKIVNPTNKNTKYLNAYSNWDRKQEELLINYFNQKMSINNISIKMQRSKGAIRKKLRRLGFDPDYYSENSGLDL